MATAAERQRRLRTEKRARGLCGESGCSRLSGDNYYCREHAEGRPRVLSVSRDLHDRLVAAADEKGARLSVLTEVLLEKGLEELRGCRAA